MCLPHTPSSLPDGWNLNEASIHFNFAKNGTLQGGRSATWQVVSLPNSHQGCFIKETALFLRSLFYQVSVAAAWSYPQMGINHKTYAMNTQEMRLLIATQFLVPY